MKISLSLILPVFNAELYLKKSLDSLLNQSFDFFELIIVNDGSTDNSLSIIKDYEKSDPRIIIINRDNKGLVYSLNEAISISKGDFIVRMDADDISYANRLSLQVKKIEEENLDICGCDYEIIDAKGSSKKVINVPKSESSIIISAFLGVPFAHGSVIIRKSFLTQNRLKYGLTNYIVAEDKALWQQLIEYGAKFGNVSEVLYSFRDHDTSLSQVKKKLNIRDNIALRHDFFHKNSKLLLREIKNQIKKISYLNVDRKNDLLEAIIYLIIYGIKHQQLKLHLVKHLFKFNILKIFYYVVKSIKLQLV